MATVKKVSSKAKTSKSTKAKVGNTKKVTRKKVNKKDLDQKNIKDTVTKVVETKRELKYDYPNEMKDTLKRKKFRQKVRNKINSFQLHLLKLDEKSKEYKKLDREYKSYRKEVLLVP
ncbi:MAG: hypothetical protein CL596_05135 [Alteromonas sp.]|mgnify:CR=1 FL=1|nr:hypothetical protein [Alteromonas sp.]|tara:strand:- start:18838 stop:19188 length:351 start_codon:yes stop_codon:yes gene_type:complete